MNEETTQQMGSAPSPEGNGPDRTVPQAPQSGNPPHITQGPGSPWQPTTAYVTNPGGHATSRFPGQTQKQQRPNLQPGISLGALGVILVIAGIGLWVMISALGSENASQAGQAVLISTGLIVLVAGLVLGWAAWKGLRPGWFLWFSIAGAVLMGPVILGGVGMWAAGENYDDYAYYASEYDWDEDGQPGPFYFESEDWEQLIERHDQIIEGNRDFPVTWLNPETNKVELEDGSAILDLTGVKAGEDASYSVDIVDSELQIVLSRDQLPVIGDFFESGDFAVSALALVPVWEYPDAAKSLETWMDLGFDEDDFPLSPEASKPSNRFNFDISSEDSTIEFIIVEEGAHPSAAKADEDLGPETTNEGGNN